VSVEYDAAGRVTQQTLPDGRVIGYAYDANGNLTSIVPPGRPPHHFNYTPVNLESEYLPPSLQPPVSGLQTTYSYNLDRQLTQILRPDGQIVDFAYDTAGRLGTVTLPSGEVRTYAYDAGTGNLASIAAPDATVSFTYDGSLLTSESWSGTGLTSTSASRTYDNNFRITGLQVNSEPPVTLGYDNDGLLTRAGSLTLSRDPANGLLTGTTFTEGTNTATDALSYSLFGELQTYAAQHNATGIYSVTYTRDKLGRIVSKSETIEGIGPTDTFYQYDQAGRLFRVCADQDCNTIQSEYLYDANGNRLAGSFNSTHGTLLSATYDDQDRLLSYETVTGGALDFTYTANGELLTKTVGSQTSTYTYL
jgi:YD repeat-containing protein